MLCSFALPLCLCRYSLSFLPAIDVRVFLLAQAMPVSANSSASNQCVIVSTTTKTTTAPMPRVSNNSRD